MAATPYTNRVRTRAMHRAMARLRDLHRDEYETLLAEELPKAHAEALEQLRRVRNEHPGEKPPAKPSNVPGPKFTDQLPVPPRMQPGPRSEPVLRDDVALCPYCASYHRRGHTCLTCGQRPIGAPPAAPYQRRTA